MAPTEQSRLPVARPEELVRDESWTGLTAFDAMIGPVRHRSMVIHAEAGVDPVPLLLESLRAALSRGERAFYISDRPWEEVRSDFVRLGHPAAPLEALVHFVNPRQTPETLPRALPALLERAPGIGVCAEPLRPEDADAVVRVLEEGIRPVLAATRQDEWGPAGVLHVRATARTPAGVAHPTLRLGQRALPFQVERPGGARAQIGRIVVTGAHNAGKSSLVQTLSPSGVSIERLGTTVALDHGRLTHRGLVVDLYGTPGQERFDPLIRQAGQGALGIVVVVDSTRPNTLHRAQTLATEVGGPTLPLVWAANKQDVAGALTPAEVAQRLGVDPAAVVGTRATHRTDALAVLDRLLERILGFLPE